MRDTGIAGRLRAGAWWSAIALALIHGGAEPAAACWDDHPGAEREFREGYESYSKGQWEDAIARFRKAKADRRDPDGSCPVQLYGRSRRSKAYYLPYFYLGVASFRRLDESGNHLAACEDAEMFFGMSMRWRGETFDIYRSRFRNEWGQLTEIQTSCGFDLGTDVGDSMARRRSDSGRQVGGGE